ncbi:Bet v1-like protein [Dioscorea alata]|nr:Bet v1-like protein [Dioscorea alata]KAH7666341.1 Bet v1-like protein [Dioscorea alata]KAH7666342.1 Bet v1-like protein [Dioscorea alata]
MDKIPTTVELRERLDRTLSSPDLMNEESLRSLVKDQLLRSPFCGTEGDFVNVVEKRTAEVQRFIEMLTSASVTEKDTSKDNRTSHKDWKVKQDTDKLRVMYREGPDGTPFHTLLAEGQVDGPVDVCLCVSWESTLYRKWWPQYNIPPFKIALSSCLQKVRIGEDISLIRVKVPWPVSDREALLHYFEIEYFKEDLIFVLLNTISDAEDIDMSTHGFSKDGIPEAKDIVRVDLVGGFVVQKVNSNKSYFRTIATMDVKLDFVPPWLINFISRQLIGNGYKLYNKAVGTVATSDESYRLALEGPMYARIHDALEKNKNHGSPLTGVGYDEAIHLPGENTEPPGENKGETLNSVAPVSGTTFVNEIVEEETGETPSFKGNQIPCGPLADLITEKHPINRERALISPEVEIALHVVDKAIAIVRNRGSYDKHSTAFLSSDLNHPTPETQAEVRYNSGYDPLSAVSSTDGHPKASWSRVEDSRDDCLGSPSIQVNGGQQLSSLEDGYKLEDASRISTHEKSVEGMISGRQPPFLDSMSKICDERSLKANGSHNVAPFAGGKPKKGGTRRKSICCFSMQLS